MSRHRRISGAPAGIPPVVLNFVGTGASYTFDVSQAGTVYIVANSSATLLSPATVKSNALGLTGGSGYYSGLVASGTNSFSLTGTFTPGSTYYLHAIAETAGVLSLLDVVGTAYVEPVVAPSIRSSSVVTGGNVTSGTVTVPTNVNGDKMLLILGTNYGANQVPSPNPPTGWTLLASNTPSAGNCMLYVFERIAASEPGSYTVPMVGFSRFGLAIVVMQNCSGKGNYIFTDHPSGTSLATGTITATANSLIFSLCCFDQDTITLPGSTTTVLQTTSAATGLTALAIVVEGPVSAGTTTARTFTDSAAGTSFSTMALEMKA